MRNVLYPAGQASYIETYQGARDRTREDLGEIQEDVTLPNKISFYSFHFY